MFIGGFIKEKYLKKYNISMLLKRKKISRFSDFFRRNNYFREKNT